MNNRRKFLKLQMEIILNINLLNELKEMTEREYNWYVFGKKENESIFIRYDIEKINNREEISNK